MPDEARVGAMFGESLHEQKLWRLDSMEPRSPVARDPEVRMREQGVRSEDREKNVDSIVGSSSLLLRAQQLQLGRTSVVIVARDRTRLTVAASRRSVPEVGPCVSDM